MTFAAPLVVVAAIGRVLAGGTALHVVLDDLREHAEAAAVAIERLLERRRSSPTTLPRWLGRATASVILGRGPARAAAEMGALTLKEAVGLPIESLETAQFRHGPLELAGPDLAAIVIATEPETSGPRRRSRGRTGRGRGSGLLVVEDGDGPIGATRIELGPLDRLAAPAVSIVPAQLLAWRLAVLRGRPPGSYLRASKVTTRE